MTFLEKVRLFAAASTASNVKAVLDSRKGVFLADGGPFLAELHWAVALEMSRYLREFLGIAREEVDDLVASLVIARERPLDSRAEPRYALAAGWTFTPLGDTEDGEWERVYPPVKR